MTVGKRGWWTLGILAVLVAGVLALRGKKQDAPQYFTAKADHGDIRQVVEATGTINAVTTVQVGSQVSGRIAQLFADFNSRVKKDQLIAQIDPAIFEGTLLQARADLENARANSAAARANLIKAQANATQTRADFARNQGLAKEGVISQQQLDLARANSESGDASVSAAQAQVTQAEAQVQQKKAAVTVADTNLRYTRIIAPIAGTVIARNVDVGQTVAASLQAPTLFTIAQDLTKMQVYASTDESDVGMIKTGQDVTFKVDAYPKETFTGRVSQVRMNATTVQNVVTYNTVIDFDNPGQKLFPGMTAYITIPVAVAQNTLRVPNGALRFKPDMSADDIRALYKKYGLSAGDAQAAQGGNGGAGAEGRQQRARTQGENGGGGATGSGPSSGGQRPGSAAAPGQNRRQDAGIVWKLLPDKTLEPIRIRIGITDHTTTEVVQVLNGELQEGTELVTGAASKGPTLGPGLGGQAPRR